MNYIFNVELAAKIGLDESILLENLVFWIKKNKANKKHEHGGKNWTYNSTSAFHELFPFWSLSQIKRILKSLLNQDVIVIDCFNENRYDRTNWYSLSNSYYYLIDETKSANGEDQNSQCTLDEISQSLINTDINSFINSDVNSDVNKNKQKEKIPAANASDCVNEIYEYWNEKTKQNLKGDKQIIKSLETILKDYTLDDIKKVIDYMILNPWFRQSRNLAISVLARTNKFGEKLDKALIYQNEKPQQSTSEVLHRCNSLDFSINDF